MSLRDNKTVGQVIDDLQHLISQGLIDRTTPTTVEGVRRVMDGLAHVVFNPQLGRGVADLQDEIARLEDDVRHWKSMASE